MVNVRTVMALKMKFGNDFVSWLCYLTTLYTGIRASCGDTSHCRPLRLL